MGKNLTMDIWDESWRGRARQDTFWYSWIVRTIDCVFALPMREDDTLDKLPRQYLKESLSQSWSTINAMADEPLAIPLDEIQVDDKLNFIEEPVEIMDREVKRLKQNRILIVKGRWEL
ncbi:hypothetical protein Tco_0302682 [Tanacetum coccineum]